MATQGTIQAPPVVSREQWIAERRALLAREKELTHLTDEVSRQRRTLPWVRLEKAYTFTGPDGEVSLADLFQGRSQLIVYHFMYGPTMKEACPSCSLVADHFDATLPHLGARDVALAVKDVLTVDPIIAFEDEDAEVVLTRMRRRGVRRIPVVDREGRLVGIFAVDDMLDQLANDLRSIVTLVTNQRRFEETHRP